MKYSYDYKGLGAEIDQIASWDYIRQGYLLCPRTVFKGRTRTQRSGLPCPSVKSRDLPSVAHKTLESAMGPMQGFRRAIMFSGGFDSLLLTYLAQSLGAQVKALTVQFESYNPMTVAGSIETAESAGLEHHILHVNLAEFLSSFEQVARLTDEPVLDLELAVSYAALRKYDPDMAGDTFISGMGGDQWLGDVALDVRYGNFDQRLVQSNVNEDAHHRVAETCGYQFIFPFLSGPMLSLSQVVPAAMKKNKKILRQLALANIVAPKGSVRELQVPILMRRILIELYGKKAWPSPVAFDRNKSSDEHLQDLRKIVLGLWLSANTKKLRASKA